MKFNLSITISAIVALVALISPILTTLLNNRYLLKVKKLEVQQKKYEQYSSHVRTLFEDFLKYYGEYMGNKLSTKSEMALKSSFYKCLPYVPEKAYDHFSEFYELVVSGDISKTSLYMKETLLYDIRRIIDN